MKTEEKLKRWDRLCVRVLERKRHFLDWRVVHELKKLEWKSDGIESI